MIPFPPLPKFISLYIAIGVFLGAAIGVTFGPRVAILIPVEQIFDMLLQTIIILYIPASLMHGLGALHPHEAGRILLKAVSFLLFLWVIVLSSCYLAAFFVPTPEAAVIDIKSDPRGIIHELLRYLIPKNPFSDAIQNVLPPLAIFSLIIGAAFMHQKTKEPLISLLVKGEHVLEKILIWLVILSPIKAVLHYAVVSGTLDLTMLIPVLFYPVVVVIISLFMALFFLPMLVTIFTPLTYIEVLKHFAFVGLACFATGQPLIAFPFIGSMLRKIRLKYRFPFQGWRASYLLIAPLAFSFSQLGNMTSLFFAQFFAFFFHSPLTIAQQLVLPLLAIILTIGSPSSSLQNLIILDQQLNLPAQALGYIGDLRHVVVNFKMFLNAAGVFSLIILVMMFHQKKLRAAGKKLVGLLVFSFIALGSLLYLAHLIVPPKDNYKKSIAELRLEDALPELPSMKLVPHPENVDRTPLPVPQRVLLRVLEQKKLRVGFFGSIPPYSYPNDKGDIVGFDIALMAQLSVELGVELELTQIDLNHLSEDLRAGIYDIAVGGFLMDFIQLRKVIFSDFYDQETNYLITLRENAKNYTNLSHIQNQKGLHIGALGPTMANIAQQHFPLAQITVYLSYQAMLQDLLDRKTELYFGSSRANYIHALENPRIVCIDFGEDLGKEYVAFAMAPHESIWREFINEWLELKQQSGFVQHQIDHWFNNKPQRPETPRWNLIDYIKKSKREKDPDCTPTAAQ